MFLVRHAVDIMNRNIQILPETTRLSSLSHVDASHVLATHAGRVTSILPATIIGQPGSQTLADVALPDFIVVGSKDVAHDVIEQMWNKNVSMALVVDVEVTMPPSSEAVIGVITKAELADNMAGTVLNFRNM